MPFIFWFERRKTLKNLADRAWEGLSKRVRPIYEQGFISLNDISSIEWDNISFLQIISIRLEESKYRLSKSNVLKKEQVILY